MVYHHIFEHTSMNYLSYRTLFCRFSGLEAFALDSRRFKDRALLWKGGRGGVGRVVGRAAFVLVPQLCLKTGLWTQSILKENFHDHVKPDEDHHASSSLN